MAAGSQFLFFAPTSGPYQPPGGGVGPPPVPSPVTIPDVVGLQAALNAKQNQIEHIIYASDLSSLDAVGITPEGRAAAINAAIVGGGLEFVFDIPLTINDGLVVYSNTILRGLGDCKLTQKANGSGWPMIRNAHPIPSGAFTDHDIFCINLNLDHNARNAGLGTNILGFAFCNALGYVEPAIALSGADHVLVMDGYCYDMCAYGVRLANVSNAVVQNWRCVRNPLGLGGGDAAGQVQGHSKNVYVINNSGTVLDNTWAVNANDGNDLPPSGPLPITFRPGWVEGGPIDNIQFEGLYPEECGSFLRLLSARTSCPITNVTVTNAEGPCYNSAVLSDTFGISPDIDGFSGWYDQIHFRNLHARGGALVNPSTGTVTGQPIIDIQRCRMGTMTFEDGPRADANRPARLISFTQGSTLYRFSAHGLVHLGVPITITDPVRNDGFITEFDVEIDNIEAQTATTRSAVAISCPTSGATGMRRVRVQANKVRGFERVAGFYFNGILVPPPTHVLVSGTNYTPYGIMASSDTIMNRVTVAPCDADFAADLPAGSGLKTDGTAWVASATGLPSGTVEVFNHFLGRATTDNAGGTPITTDGQACGRTKSRFTNRGLHTAADNATRPTWKAGVQPYLIFDPTNNQLLSDAVNTLPLGSASRTFKFWLKVLSYPSGPGWFMSYGSLVATEFVGLSVDSGVSGGGLSFTQFGGGTAGGGQLLLNVWYHIMLTRDDAIPWWRWYNNGQPVASSNPATNTTAGDGNLYLGALASGSGLHCAIAQFEITSTAMTDALAPHEYLAAIDQGLADIV